VKRSRSDAAFITCSSGVLFRRGVARTSNSWFAFMAVPCSLVGSPVICHAAALVRGERHLNFHEDRDNSSVLSRKLKV